MGDKWKKHLLKWVENLHSHKNPTREAAASFTIAKNWKQPRCSSVGEETNKLWYIYTIE